MFKVDKKLKDQANKKAQREGLPLAYILKLATKAYVDGFFRVDLVPTEKLNTASRKALGRGLKDATKGKNLSPSFTSAKEAIRFLSL